MAISQALGSTASTLARHRCCGVKHTGLSLTRRSVDRWRRGRGVVGRRRWRGAWAVACALAVRIGLQQEQSFRIGDQHDVFWSLIGHDCTVSYLNYHRRTGSSGLPLLHTRRHKSLHKTIGRAQGAHMGSRRLAAGWGCSLGCMANNCCLQSKVPVRSARHSQGQLR